jgi:hypothetical protein
LSVLLALLLVSPAQAQSADRPRINVTISVFAAGVPEDRATQRDLQVFPKIREIETKFLPFILRDVLENNNDWGAVRVVATREVAAELSILGTIVHSDGDALELRIEAVDASGRVWLDDVFAGAVTADYSDGGTQAGTENYPTLFQDIAARLRVARDNFSDRELSQVIEISLLRYGKMLVPSAFEGFFEEADDGTITVLRLPAVDDPMIARIKLVRETEYVITDAVDTKFQELYAEIDYVYDIWRDYRKRVIAYQAEDVLRAERTRDEGQRGSYEAIQNQYDNYRFARITSQEQDRAAVAFSNEVGPKIEAMEERIAELADWVEGKNAEWNRILEELFEVETGLAD